MLFSNKHFAGREAVLTTLVLLTGLALGQSPEKAAAYETLAAKVKALVGMQGLGSDELAKREAAEKELIAIGADVLPLLPATTARTPAEDRIRLGRIRAALEKTVIEAATRPSVVTLSGEMPISEALAKITAARK